MIPDADSALANLHRVHLIFRTLWMLAVRSRRAPRLGISDVGSVRLRVLLTDIDIIGHLNNGMYFSFMDLGRMDLLVRAGAWARLRRLGIYPVMASETITFRKSLDLGVRFDLETRMVGIDDRAVYVEQRFVVNGEIYAQAMTRGRFLRKTGGTVPTAELAEILDVDVASHPVPAWVQEWADRVALPSTRGEAPSVWE